ncbi:glycosyltransferase family 4 protein [Phreatobacter stygius]|uniref:glycosyltransferase family 4 protein n=1 Tax=Phreatobacter stygius TaxID=1940610 RepID=UPI001476C834|nr:glycosyltransferase family 1 protein [Phreatobacter stygius]
MDADHFDRSFGTGIATYSRVLAQTYRGLGHRVIGLFGRELNPFLTARAQEMAFFGFQARRRRWSIPRAVCAMRPWPIAVTPIEPTGTVDLEPIADQFSPFDGIANLDSLTELAHLHFALTRRFLPVRAPAGVEFVHWAHPKPVYAVGARNIYTVHDLVPIMMPYAVKGRCVKYDRLFAGVVKHADRIFTVSENARADLLRLYPADPARVMTTFQAAPFAPETAGDDPEDLALWLRARHGLDARRYLIYYGAIEPKKNIDRLIAAYLRADVAMPLVIISSSGWSNRVTLAALGAAARQCARGAEQGKSIIRLPYLPYDEVMRLVQGAAATLFPSIHEGFGIPILESMQQRTPVLTADRTATREIAGDAALLVDPFDETAIARGIERMTGDPMFCRALVEKGSVRAQFFSTAAYRERLGAALAAF